MNPQELKTQARDISTKSARPTADYIQWFRDAVRRDDPDQLMSLVIQHTQNWALANAIVDNYDQFVTAMLEAEHRHGLKTHKIVSPEEAAILKRVFVAKFLHEAQQVEGVTTSSGSGFGFSANSKEFE